MVRPLPRLFLPLSTALLVQAQSPLDPSALLALKNQVQAQGGMGAADVLPQRASLPGRDAVKEAQAEAQQRSEDDRIAREIRALKAREKGPLRFAADLFEVRQRGTAATEGGIAEGYILGAGDQLNLNVFGSATFELPVQVDGRGELVIPKVGAVKVAGLTLGRARQAVQGLVSRQFSAATVDLQAVKLREIRVFVLGEVYRPGGYVVPSLSSLVNILSLAGGPTAAGSYRQIRVVRGGKVVHSIDLYPLRAEGLGNMNVALQNGDTIFVPLAFHQVILEGAFQRVVAATGLLGTQEDAAPQDDERARLELELRSAEDRLARFEETPQASGRSESPRYQGGTATRQPRSQDQPIPPAPSAKEPLPDAAPGQAMASDAFPEKNLDRPALEARIQSLRYRLKRLREQRRGDHRLKGQLPFETPQDNSPEGQPAWLTRWQDEGRVPRMHFEMLPGESAADALRFAGGMAAQAFAGTMSLRRMDASGAQNVLDVPADRAATIRLERGDVLSALPKRDQLERAVTLQGWVRVPGTFARTEGLKVGDLLTREQQVLPDTYRGRGEIVRTLPDGRTHFLAFDVAKALAGDPAHNLALENRDRVELYRTQDLRLPKTVQVLGPVSRPGTFRFHEGMRASDLLFQAGIPLEEADRFHAELAHMRDGKPSEIRKLDLTRLLSTEQGSPVDLKDDAANPLLEPFDQLSVYARPDYRRHRSVRLSGQVRRPGTYALDGDRVSLRDVLARAGGLTPEAMPRAAVFLRSTASQDPEKMRAALESGIPATDPTAQGIDATLERLNETKRQPTTGQLLKSPLLHGLQTGGLNRLVVDIPAILSGDRDADVALQDGDEIIFPRQTDSAYVVGEAASPFAVYKVRPGMTVKQLLAQAGGPTRNADTWNIRLLKADGRIVDSWVNGRKVEPGDTVLVPQRVRRDTTWQENLQALTPIALIVNAVK